MSASKPRRLLTTEQVQELIPAHVTTLKRYVKRGWLPAPIKLHPGQQARVYWDAERVEQALAQFGAQVSP